MHMRLASDILFASSNECDFACLAPEFVRSFNVLKAGKDGVWSRDESMIIKRALG